jgi:hypothetical protein
MGIRDTITIIAALIGAGFAAVAAFLGAYWFYFNRGR